MSIDPPEVPLPPSPMQGEPPAEPDWRLSWWTVLYLTVAVLPASLERLVALGVSFAPGTPPVSTWSWAPMTLRTARLAAGPLISGAIGALGIVLADHVAPAGWPRRLRWAVGAGLASLVPSPLRLLYSGGVGPFYASAFSILSTLASAAVSGFIAFYIARFVRRGTRLWRTLPLAGMEAGLLSLLMGLAFSYGVTAFAPSLLHQGRWVPGWGDLLFIWKSVVVVVACGLLRGLAIAAGLHRSRQRQERQGGAGKAGTGYAG